MVFRKLTPDAVNRAATTVDGVAGKSVNVAKVLKALGQRPVAAGFVGGDRGEEVCRALAARGVEMEFVRTAARTRQCITVIDQSAGTITELVEESRPVEASDYEDLLRIIQRRVPGSRAVILSGTITPGGPVDLYGRCVALAREHGALSVVDAQGAVLMEALKAGPGLVKPNRTELAATVGAELKDEAAVVDAMRELSRRGAARVVVTAGKDPGLAFDGQSVWRITSPRIATLNPIGSGDAFTAGLAWRLLAGDDLGEACRWAAAAGAANALTIMAGELEKGEVERLAPQVRVDRLSQAAA